MTLLCPCGSGRNLDQCCGPILDDPRHAETAEALMRSRYTANTLGRWNHLWATWHPRTRPDVVDSQGVEWTGLQILATKDGNRATSREWWNFAPRTGPGSATTSSMRCPVSSVAQAGGCMSTGTSTKHLVLARLRRGRRDDAIEPCAVRTGRGMTTTGHCALRLMSQIPTPHNGVGLIVLAVVVVSSWLTPLDGRRTSWHGHG